MQVEIDKGNKVQVDYDKELNDYFKEHFGVITNTSIWFLY